MQNVWILFVVGAFLSWGAYGPSLHGGQMAFQDAERTLKSLRALLCVGGAYFVVGVVVPLIWLAMKGQVGGFTAKGTVYSSLAGTLGAIGAVCIILAFANGGKPFIVMPLVFAGAPIINAVISLSTHPPAGGMRKIHPMLYVGFFLAAAGAYLVLAYKDRALE